MNNKGNSNVSRLSSREVGCTSRIKFHPITVHYFKPRTTTTPDSDLNKTTYYEDEFMYVNGYATPNVFIHNEILSSMAIRTYYGGGNPRRLMRIPKGDIVPAHVPLKEDYMVGQNKWARMFILWYMLRMQRESDLVVLKDLQVVIDPRPFVDPQPSVTLLVPDTPTYIFMGDYSYGVHAMEVSSTIHTIHLDVGSRKLPKFKNRYFVSHVRPKKRFHIENRPPILEGTIVLLWNCRGMTRNSLEDTFIFLYHKYLPSIFVLSETRISKDALDYVERKLGTNYKLEVFGLIGGPGGVALLWDSVLLTHFFEHGGYNDRGRAMSVIYKMHRTKVEYEEEDEEEEEEEKDEDPMSTSSSSSSRDDAAEILAKIQYERGFNQII